MAKEASQTHDAALTLVDHADGAAATLDVTRCTRGCEECAQPVRCESGREEQLHQAIHSHDAPDTATSERGSFLRKLLIHMGPGLMVCFADTDGSCLITAADSGARWGYKLLMLQVVLVPILFFAQELTCRLALVRGRGLTALLRDEVGPVCGWVLALFLVVDCFLALISEISVVGQTMEYCWGWERGITNTIFTLLLLALALTGSYNVAEKVGLAMGVLQVVFFGTAFLIWPHITGKDLIAFPVNEKSYTELVTANIGAVIMPWMLAYQQSALCEKGVDPSQHASHIREHLLIERIDTGLGSFLTQGVMAAMLVTVAASPIKPSSVGSIQPLIPIFTEAMGSEVWAKIILTFAIVGACMVAAIVESLCASWVLEEAIYGDRIVWTRVAGTSRSRDLFRKTLQRKWYLGTYVVNLVVAWLLTVVSQEFSERLTGVPTQFVNGILMPPVVAALWYLCAFRLPPDYAIRGFYKWLTGTLFFVCAGFCIASIFVAG